MRSLTTAEGRSVSPSPAREREGPDPQGREGEGSATGKTLTRLASLATLSDGAGEGLIARVTEGPLAAEARP